jgi:hypothetical protein
LPVALTQNDVAFFEAIFGAYEYGLSTPDLLDSAEGRDGGSSALLDRYCR